MATAAIAVLSLAVYVVLDLNRPIRPGRGPGLWFGIIAAVLFVLESLYPLRKKLLSRPFGSAQRWLQLHIWGGWLAALFVLIHSDFRRPGGTIGWLLLLLTIWVTLSGFLGVVLQKYGPVALSQNLTVEALFERIPELVSRLSAEGDQLAEGGSEVLQGFYQSEVRPSLMGVDPSWSYLTDLRGGREQKLLPFTRMGPFVPEDERSRLEDMKTIFVEKLELDASYSVQRALRGWTVLHVPPAILLIALLLVHIGAFLLY